jgi:hypothetical protein
MLSIQAKDIIKNGLGFRNTTGKNYIETAYYEEE